jgi:hypothetical protein
MTRLAPSPVRQKQPREVDGSYKAWIARLPCVICAREPVEVAHVRFADARYGKTEPGMAAKPDDVWTLPLCPGCHRLEPHAQHGEDEREWWDSYEEMHGINALALCLVLRYRAYPDEAVGRAVLAEWRG